MSESFANETPFAVLLKIFSQFDPSVAQTPVKLSARATGENSNPDTSASERQVFGLALFKGAPLMREPVRKSIRTFRPGRSLRAAKPPRRYHREHRTARCRNPSAAAPSDCGHETC